MADDWKKKVFEDSGLWVIYWKSVGSMPRSAFNRGVYWFSFILIALLTGFAVVSPSDLYGLAQSAAFVHQIADAGLVISLGILGFLIAGFSIFASVTKPELFIVLAKIPYKRDGETVGISRLQFLFFNFLNVFSVYLLLFSISLFISIGFAESSPLRILSQAAMFDHPMVMHAGNCLSMAALLLWFVESVLRLKSFVWNLYQAVLISIATESELRDRERQAAVPGVRDREDQYGE